MTLEDDPCDIIAKAIRGQGLSVRLLSEKTKITEAVIQSVLDGEVNTAIISRLSDVLGLSAAALLSLDSYCEEVAAPDGVHMFTSDYGYLGVNAYLIIHGETATVFDTGTDACPIIEFAHKHQLQISHLYITHRHADHMACLDSFKDIPVTYPEDLEHGQVINKGGLQLTMLDVSGHASNAIAYLYEGLSSPVCICGDSLFAGSMGGAPDEKRYQQALRTAKGSILSLPDETIICPGHGPLTTVAFENRNNPFFAG